MESKSESFEYKLFGVDEIRDEREFDAVESVSFMTSCVERFESKLCDDREVSMSRIEFMTIMKEVVVEQILFCEIFSIYFTLAFLRQTHGKYNYLDVVNGSKD